MDTWTEAQWQAHWAEDANARPRCAECAKPLPDVDARVYVVEGSYGLWACPEHREIVALYVEDMTPHHLSH